MSSPPRAGGPARRSARTRGAARPSRAQQSSRQLLAVAEALRRRIRDGLLARGHELGPSHTQVAPNLPLAGIRMTDLAARLRLTIQRTGQLVRDLEEAGYVEVVRHEDDGRARLVVHSRRGLRLLRDVREITEEAWRDYAKRVGRERIGALRDGLAALDAALHGDDAPLDLPPARAPRRRARAPSDPD